MGDCCSGESLERLKSQRRPLFMFHCMYVFHHFYFSSSIRVTYGKTVWFNRYWVGKNPRWRAKGLPQKNKTCLLSAVFQGRMSFFYWNGHIKNFSHVVNLISCKQLSHNTWNGLSSLKNTWNVNLYMGSGLWWDASQGSLGRAGVLQIYWPVGEQSDQWLQDLFVWLFFLASARVGRDVHHF